MEIISMRAFRSAQEFIINGRNLNFAIHIDGIALGPYYNPDTGLVQNQALPIKWTTWTIAWQYI